MRHMEFPKLLAWYTRQEPKSTRLHNGSLGKSSTIHEEWVSCLTTLSGGLHWEILEESNYFQDPLSLEISSMQHSDTVLEKKQQFLFSSHVLQTLKTDMGLTWWMVLIYFHNKFIFLFYHDSKHQCHLPPSCPTKNTPIA